MMSARTDLRDLRDDRLHRSASLLHQKQQQQYLHSTFAGLALSAGASPATTPLSSAPSSSVKRVRFEDEGPGPVHAEHLAAGSGPTVAAEDGVRILWNHGGDGRGNGRGALPPSASRSVHDSYTDDDDDDGGDPEAALRGPSTRPAATHLLPPL